MMKIPIRKGIGFGLTSGVITTLGLIIGLNSVVDSKKIIIAGILTIAVADAFSDSLGFHISEESGKKKSESDIWNSTFATFFSKLVFALSFLIPVLLFELNIAIMISIIWGLFLILIFSYYIAKTNKKNPFWVMSEHLIITVLVIVITHFFGSGLNKFFS